MKIRSPPEKTGSAPNLSGERYHYQKGNVQLKNWVPPEIRFKVADKRDQIRDFVSVRVTKNSVILQLLLFWLTFWEVPVLVREHFSIQATSHNTDQTASNRQRRERSMRQCSYEWWTCLWPIYLRNRRSLRVMQVLPDLRGTVFTTRYFFQIILYMWWPKNNF